MSVLKFGTLFNVLEGYYLLFSWQLVKTIVLQVDMSNKSENLLSNLKNSSHPLDNRSFSSNFYKLDEFSTDETDCKTSIGTTQVGENTLMTLHIMPLFSNGINLLTVAGFRNTFKGKCFLFGGGAPTSFDL